MHKMALLLDWNNTADVPVPRGVKLFCPYIIITVGVIIVIFNVIIGRGPQRKKGLAPLL